VIASMEEIAGARWMPEHTRAWQNAFAIVARVMLEGAADEEARLAAAA
jgi:hemoglobin-like flavoprotein